MSLKRGPMLQPITEVFSVMWVYDLWMMSLRALCTKDIWVISQRNQCYHLHEWCFFFVRKMKHTNWFSFPRTHGKIDKHMFELCLGGLFLIFWTTWIKSFFSLFLVYLSLNIWLFFFFLLHFNLLKFYGKVQSHEISLLGVCWFSVWIFQ